MEEGCGGEGGLRDLREVLRLFGFRNSVISGLRIQRFTVAAWSIGIAELQAQGRRFGASQPQLPKRTIKPRTVNLNPKPKYDDVSFWACPKPYSPKTGP